MSDTRIGRVLVASLHEAIGELLPARLEFYETWLHPSGVAMQGIGRAPLSAVLSFLRHEERAYEPVMTRAGEYAAIWTFTLAPASRRAALKILPAGWRARWALRMACGIIRATSADTRAAWTLRSGRGRVTVEGSVFCAARTPVDDALCAFHAACVRRMFELARLDARVGIEECRARGASACRLSFDVAGRPWVATDRLRGPLQLAGDESPASPPEI